MRFFSRIKESSFFFHSGIPTLMSSSIQFLKGSALLATSYLVNFFSNEDTNEMLKNNAFFNVLRVTSYALLLQTVYQFITVGTLYLLTPKTSPKELIHKKNQKRKNSAIAHEPENSNYEKMVRYNTLLRKQQLIKGTYYIILSFWGMLESINYFQALNEHNISPLSLSFPEHFKIETGPIIYYIFSPIIISLVKLSTFGLVIYNTREFVQTLESHTPRRGDIPIMGMLNSLNELNMTSGMTLYIQDSIDFKINEFKSFLIFLKIHKSEVYDAQKISLFLNETKSKLLRLSKFQDGVKLLHFNATYNFYRNSAQMIFNFQSLFFNQVKYVVKNRNFEETLSFSCRASKKMTELQDWFLDTVPIEVEYLTQPLSFTETAAILSSHTTQQLTRQGNLSFLLASNSTRSASTSSASSISNVSAATRANPKTKRRGIANPRLQENNPNNIEEAEEETLIHWISDEVRREQLDNISELRTRNQVNQRTIRRELDGLISGSHHLPGGRITGIDGSEQHLCWQSTTKRYAVKFETCHGTHEEYKGTKLRKILNVIEAAYLWQWEQSKVDNYLSQRKKSTKIEQLDYIFRERPSL